MISTTRTLALIRKESLQIMRDPSTFLIAGVLPILLLLIFGNGVSLDLLRVPVVVVVEQSTPEAESLLSSFRNSRYFDVRVERHVRAVEEELVSGSINGIIVIPADFSEQLGRGEQAPVQVLVDGADPNTAGLAQGYSQGVWRNWLQQEALAQSDLASSRMRPALISVEPRFWFNENLNSRQSLLPGAIAVILTIIGVLLTALVIAREWERGTMEALLATPASRMEFLIGKIVPYLFLGLLAMTLATTATVWWFDVPFRGSIGSLLILSLGYLSTMLMLGLLISTKTKNQFIASQAALIVGFLPAFELSGLLFEIEAMPAPIRLLTRVLPPRYFVSSLQTIFLAGDVPSVLVPNAIILFAFAAVFFVLLYRSTLVRLE
ncbi:MAG: ABC transporter permease [Planctomycetales bacterium]|nr:ABC transporter permease [Planctomycetales bacterium]